MHCMEQGQLHVHAVHLLIPAFFFLLSSCHKWHTCTLTHTSQVVCSLLTQHSTCYMLHLVHLTSAALPAGPTLSMSEPQPGAPWPPALATQCIVFCVPWCISHAMTTAAQMMATLTMTWRWQLCNDRLQQQQQQRQWQLPTDNNPNYDVKMMTMQQWGGNNNKGWWQLWNDSNPHDDLKWTTAWIT